MQITVESGDSNASSCEYSLIHWQYRETGTSQWNASSQPHPEIFLDLLAAHKIPDPFVDANETKVQWVGETDWEYRLEFTLNSYCKRFSKHKLCFEGLDTFATVYLNGVEILSAQNMFREYAVDVGKLLTYEGPNQLHIVFKSALVKGRELQDSHKKYVCSNGDPSRLYVRKAQYHYGWDWGPVLMGCGPYKPVKLKMFDVYIDDVYVDVEVSRRLEAKFCIQVQVDGVTPSELTIETSGPLESVVNSVSLARNTATVHHQFTLRHPKLWYPIGYGQQPLYTVVVTLKGQKVVRQVGVRRVELVQEPLQKEPGTSFYFKVNNVGVFCQGSNWIPGHSFRSLESGKYQAWLRLAAEGNHNIVRVWGGGYYETTAFYQECDRLGLMVWQDFMFACGQYPGHDEFVEEVTREAIYQVKRLRHHCCIVLFAGNNEDYSTIEQIKEDINGPGFPAKIIYEEVIPQIVAKYCRIAYHRGSPYGGKTSNDPTVGDIHQWNVWHGEQEKYQNWFKLGGRFVSEFGMEALPSRKTLDSCITARQELYPQSRTMDFHNKAAGFERRLATYVMENIRVGSMDLDSWIYATQLMQAECLTYAYRSWRREWRGKDNYNCGGVIVWQLNDCWPVTSWSIVDVYRRPKLAYYAVKRECQPTTLGIQRTGNTIHVWGFSLLDRKESLIVDFYDVTSGRKLDTKTVPVVFVAHQSTPFLSCRIVSEPTVIHARLHGSDIGASDWPQPLKYLTFPDRTVEYRVGCGTICLQTNKPVKGVEIVTDDIFLDDNGFDLFPGETKVVTGAIQPHSSVAIRYYDQVT